MLNWRVWAAVIVIAACGAAGKEGDLPTGGASGLFSAFAITSHTQVSAGQTFHVALTMEVAEGWVFYSPSPGGGEFTPIPASIAVTAGPWQVGAVLWPRDRQHPTNVGDAVVTTFGYTGKVVAYVPITVPADAQAGKREIQLTVSGQVCSEEKFQCVPVRAEVAATVQVGTSAVTNEAWSQAMRDGLASARPAEQSALRRLLNPSPLAGRANSASGRGWACRCWPG